MKALSGKNIVLGVTGGIAVYKAVDVVSRLVKLGANIDVIMTKNATEFVSPLTFESMSNNPVISSMFAKVNFWDIEHISLAKKADIFAIIPATANIIGKVANGIADDMLTTTIMATKAKILIAPAMNTNMYENPLYKQNEDKLKDLGYIFIDPAKGRLACGDSGSGKLADTEKIAKRIEFELLKDNALKGNKVLVTAGPTVEKIDPVRYITNRSTGKMGYSIAKEAKLRGANVTLITGPTNLKKPDMINVIETESAEDMYKKVIENNNFDICIMTAAVSDYRPKNQYKEKYKKNDNDFKIDLVRNKDILFELGKIKKKQILVGFAAETENILEYAEKKLNKKNLDFIVANDVSSKDAGFKSDNNKVKIIDKDKNIDEYDLMLKSEVAKIIIEKIISLKE